jgi:plasmid maintenance system antidote protein VapI
MTAEFWMNLQSHYDLESARDASEKKIRRTVRPAPRSRKARSLKAAAA